MAVWIHYMFLNKYKIKGEFSSGIMSIRTINLFWSSIIAYCTQWKHTFYYKWHILRSSKTVLCSQSLLHPRHNWTRTNRIDGEDAVVPAVDWPTRKWRRANFTAGACVCGHIYRSKRLYPWTPSSCAPRGSRASWLATRRAQRYDAAHLTQQSER